MALFSVKVFELAVNGAIVYQSHIERVVVVLLRKTPPPRMQVTARWLLSVVVAAGGGRWWVVAGGGWRWQGWSIPTVGAAAAAATSRVGVPTPETCSP